LVRTPARFHWTVALLGATFVLGAYVDAWATEKSSNPIAPWQDAPVDLAWLAIAAFLATTFGRSLAAGVAWRAALPPGYHLALAGALLFGLGALADVYYRLAFGSRLGLEALLSPPHLAQLAGGGLIVAAPLNQALRERPERAGWPVVVSAALTLAALNFFTLYANPLIDVWPARGQPQSWLTQNLGVAAIVIQTSLLIGVMLLLIRSFELPRGSLTVICALDGVFVVLVHPHVELYPVALGTGLAADGLLLRLRPEATRTTGLRVFSAVVPAAYTLLYWAAIVLLEGGSAWSGQLWIGVVLASALGGFLVSYLAGIRRPRSVVAAEAWGEHWPRRQVDLSPQLVKDALESLDDVAALAVGPLARMACVAGEGAAAGPEVRAVLIDVVRELAASKAPRDAEAGQLLVDYYVRRVGSHELIAERLHLSRPTFYRRLQRGLTLVAERLDELSEFAARQQPP
jgi:hypothetical protein